MCVVRGGGGDGGCVGTQLSLIGGNKGISYNSPLKPSLSALTLKPMPEIVLCLLFPKPSPETDYGLLKVTQQAEASFPPSPTGCAELQMAFWDH